RESREVARKRSRQRGRRLRPRPTCLERAVSTGRDEGWLSVPWRLFLWGSILCDLGLAGRKRQGGDDGVLGGKGREHRQGDECIGAPLGEDTVAVFVAEQLAPGFWGGQALFGEARQVEVVMRDKRAGLAPVAAASAAQDHLDIGGLLAVDGAGAGAADHNLPGDLPVEDPGAIAAGVGSD